MILSFTCAASPAWFILDFILIVKGNRILQAYSITQTSVLPEHAYITDML